MTRLNAWIRFAAIASISFLVFLSILFAILPANWIEFRLAIDPDGGSGLLEFLLVVTPLLIAMAIASLPFGQGLAGNLSKYKFEIDPAPASPGGKENLVSCLTSSFTKPLDLA
jgi:hypothetical protein